MYIYLTDIGPTSVVRQQPPHPRRLTSFIELFHAASFGPSTACGQVPFTFPATAVILGSSILLLSTVDPLARAGMETPTGVRCLAKPATNTSPSTPSFVSLTFLYSYFISLSLWLSPFPSFFLSGSLLLPPLSGNGLGPRYSHVATVPFSRACR